MLVLETGAGAVELKRIRRDLRGRDWIRELRHDTPRR